MNRDEMFDVSREIVVITGVAGQLGAQYAAEFASRGATVVGIDITRGPRISDIEDRYGNAFRYFSCDITDRKALRSTHLAMTNEIGRPSVLINNAAIDSPPSAPADENGPFEDYPESSWDKVTSVNLRGTFFCCQVFGGAMAESGRGSIINVSSIYGMVSPDQSLYQYRRDRGEVFFKPVAYSVSKSGILNLTRYLAIYWAKSGVRVNSLTIAGVENDQDEDFLRAYTGRIPVGRMAAADEYNGAVVFLASRASRYMTGANLVVDGGWTAI